MTHFERYSFSSNFFVDAEFEKGQTGFIAYSFLSQTYEIKPTTPAIKVVKCSGKVPDEKDVFLAGIVDASIEEDADAEIVSVHQKQPPFQFSPNRCLEG